VTETIKLIEAAQEAFQRHDWARARGRFNAARRDGRHVPGRALHRAWRPRRRLGLDEPRAPAAARPAGGTEHGYALYFDIFSSMAAGDLDGAVAHARRMQELGHRFAEPNLVAVGVLGEGRARLKQGRVKDGMALLDEAMLAALSDELHPLWAGAPSGAMTFPRPEPTVSARRCRGSCLPAAGR
jgi:hypothetical protein